MPPWLRWWHRDEDAVYVDVDDYLRRKEIREAEFQAACDEASDVQRVSGKVPEPARRLPGIVEIVRGALG